MKKLLIIMILILSIITAGTFVLAQGGPVDVAVKARGDNADIIKSSPESGTRFTDISEHWAKESIDRIALKEIFDGSDGKFHPEQAITRSEFVMLLHKSLDIQIMYLVAPDIGEFFDDVKNEDAYASALYDLTVVGIIDYKGQFGPDSTMTREEMVHFLMNAYKYKMGENYKQIKLPFKPFADNDNINPVYNGDVARAEHDGLLKRPANNKFYPGGIATRAQAVTVTDRLLMLLDKENGREKLQVQVTPSAELKDGVLAMMLTITNLSESQVVINHSSGQKFDFEVLDSARNSLYRWSADKLFIMALTETVIEPGKSVDFSADIEKDMLDGFTAKAAYVKAYITGTSENFEIKAGGYEAEVK